MEEMFQSDANIKFLKLLSRDEDEFISSLNNFDFRALLNFRDILQNIIEDHRSLYLLIYQLLKIIKAADSMTESSMILTDAIEKIVNQTCECLNCDRASVFLIDEEKEELWSKVAKGFDSTLRLPKNTGIVGKNIKNYQLKIIYYYANQIKNYQKLGYVANSGEILNIANAYTDDRFNKDIDKKTNYKTSTILCVPIMGKSGEILG